MLALIGNCCVVYILCEFVFLQQKKTRDFYTKYARVQTEDLFLCNVF